MRRTPQNPTPPASRGGEIAIETSESFTWNKFTLVMILLMVVGCLALGFALTGKFRDSAEGKARASVIEQIGPQATAQALEIERQAALLKLEYKKGADADKAMIREVLVICGIVLAIAATICIVIGIAVFTYGLLSLLLERLKGKGKDARIHVFPPDHQLGRTGAGNPELPAEVQVKAQPAPAAQHGVAASRQDRAIPISGIDGQAVQIPVAERHSNRS